MAGDWDGFIFNVERWFGSVTQQRMSFTEKGVYLAMLFQQWRDRRRSLPDDAHAVADLIAVTAAQVEDVIAAWAVVREKFVASKHTSGRIYNVELERTRRTQRAKRRKLAEAGRAGGKASVAKRRSVKNLDSIDRSTVVQRPSSCIGMGVVGVENEKKKDPALRACPHEPPCPATTTAHECHKRTILENGRKARAS